MTPLRSNHQAIFFNLKLMAVSVLLLFLSADANLNAQEKPNQHAESFSLESLLLDGHELHITLQTQNIDQIRGIPSGMVLLENPHRSTDTAFVNATARGGSQGRLDGMGMEAALYARYTDGKSEIGFYGLTAESDEVADKREQAIRDIWAHNNRLDRTHVYRKGQVLLVVWIWTKDELPASWSVVQTKVKERMGLTGFAQSQDD